jgi:hypothetical protein
MVMMLESFTFAPPIRSVALPSFARGAISPGPVSGPR